MGLFGFFRNRNGKKEASTEGKQEVQEEQEAAREQAPKAEVPEIQETEISTVPEETLAETPVEQAENKITDGTTCTFGSITFTYRETTVERPVITFEERKKTCIPTDRGLYVAEILLLDYCSRSLYPAPDGKYPQFWWYEYGLKDVDAALKSLEERGFIRMGTAKESVGGLKAARLKELLKSSGLPVSGKKADLVKRVTENVPEEVLAASGVEKKYVLTETGKQELEENEYVPYMHKHHGEVSHSIDVWDLNQRLKNEDKKHWKDVLEREELARELAWEEEIIARNKEKEVYLNSIRESEPEYYRELKAEYDTKKAADDQMIEISRAGRRYKESGDLDEYIRFWERIWADEGLKNKKCGFEFNLANLYVEAGRYDDALAFVEKVRAIDPEYFGFEADGFKTRIEELKKEKEKQAKR